MIKGLIRDYKKKGPRFVLNKIKLRSKVLRSNKKWNKNAPRVVGIIGAGNYLKHEILPNCNAKNFYFKTICSGSKENAKQTARFFNINQFTTNPQDIFTDQEINTVFITGKNSTHAKYILKAIKHKKDIFVEKPLVTNKEDLKKVKAALRKTKNKISVGYNRRFAPTVKELKQTEIKDITYTVEKPAFPQNHWVQEAKEGGPIISDMGHMIDTILYLYDYEKPQITINGEAVQFKFKKGKATLIYKAAEKTKETIQTAGKTLTNFKTSSHKRPESGKKGLFNQYRPSKIEHELLTAETILKVADQIKRSKN